MGTLSKNKWRHFAKTYLIGSKRLLCTVFGVPAQRVFQIDGFAAGSDDGMESIADEYDCSKSSVCRSIHWVEDTLSADGRFQLPGKKALQEDEATPVPPNCPCLERGREPF